MELIDSNLDTISGMIAFAIVTIIAAIIAYQASKRDMSMAEYIAEEIVPTITISLIGFVLLLIISFVVRYILQHFFNLGVM